MAPHAEDVLGSASQLAAHTGYGQQAVNKLQHELLEKTTGDDDHNIVLKSFRLLVADLCQQFGGGHPG